MNRTIKNILFAFLNREARIFLDRTYCSLYMSEEKWIFKRLCKKGKVSLDIGANKGDMALFLEKYSDKVVCFEPIGQLCQVIRNRLDSLNVEVHELALSDRKEEKTLRIPFVNGSYLETRATLVGDGCDAGKRREYPGLQKEIRIKTEALDSFKYENVGFMKIDVEGWEYEVLEGARVTIEKQKPCIFIEIEKRHLVGRGMSVEQIFGKLNDFGYEGYYCHKRKIYPLKKFDIGKMQDPRNEFYRSYINNFIFIHEKNVEERLQLFKYPE